MKQFRRYATLFLAILMVMSLVTACGNKPQPDPSQDNDVSTGVSQDENSQPDDTTDATDESGDSTDESSDATDESGDSTNESGDTTDTTVKGDTTTKKGDTTKTTVKTTTKKGDTTTTTKKGGGIIIDKTTTTTKKTTTTTTTSQPIDKTVKEEILEIFDASMKGKTISVLSAWAQGVDEKQKMDDLSAATGIKVRWQVAEGTGYATKLSALINATASPDLAMLRNSTYPSLVIKNYFQDISVTGIDFTDDLYDQDLMADFTWGGKQYAVIPKNSDNSVLYVGFYNKTMFKKLGVTDPGTLWKQGKWNWDTFLECAQKTADIDNGILGCDIYASHNFLLTSGTGVIEVGDGVIKNNLNDSRIVEAWTFINKMHHEYKVTSAVAGADTNFANGTTAILLGQAWQGNAGSAICNQTKDEWGIVPYPTKKGLGDLTIVAPTGGAIPIGAKNPKAAAGLWVYWVSYDTGVMGAGKPENLDGGYSRDEINDVKRAMWQNPKVSDMLNGVLEYGGDYSEWTFSWDIFQAGMSGINSSIDKWKSAIDVNIKRITTEFS